MQESQGPEIIPLNPCVLNLLGEDNLENIVPSGTIHKELSLRWKNILLKGLNKEAKDKILMKYPAPNNCTLVNSPELNKEVKTSLNEVVTSRDSRLMAIQSQIAAGLGAIGKALTTLLAEENQNLEVIECISDAGRLLADVHFGQTESRRSLIISNVNKKIRNTLLETPRDALLFGEDLTERIKNAKAVERSSLSLQATASYQKYQKKPATNTKSNLNSHRPSRSQYYRGHQGGRKYVSRTKVPQVGMKKEGRRIR